VDTSTALGKARAPRTFALNSIAVIEIKSRSIQLFR